MNTLLLVFYSLGWGCVLGLASTIPAEGFWKNLMKFFACMWIGIIHGLAWFAYDRAWEALRKVNRLPGPK